MRRFFSKEPNNGPIVLPTHTEISVTVRQSARAKRMSLRISSLDGRVTLTVPRYAKRADIEGFVFEKEEWIAKHHRNLGVIQPIDYGVHVPIEGHSRLIVPTDAPRIALKEAQLLVPHKRSATAAQVQGFLKTLARERLIEASDHYAAKLGLPYAKISLRDTRSRWGSCSSEGTLMYSWRLIMAPADVLRYVAAHEVAHLQEMNHSADFWKVVETLFGSYKAQRQWLHKHGAQLHHYKFKD